MKTIIFPTDFSENSLGALKWAIAFCRRYDAKLLILNTSFSGGSGTGMLVNLRERLMKDANGRMKALLKKIMESTDYGDVSGIKIETECRYESTIEGILDAVDDHKAMLICMGTRGATGVEVILGSNTSAVIARAEVPVLVVPETAEFDVVKHIAFATNLNEADFSKLKQLASLASHFEANLEFIHFSLPGQSFEDSNVDEYAEKIRTEMDYANVTLKLVKAEDVDDGIADYIEQNDVDILIMLRRNRSFWQRLFQRSHTRELALHSKVPLLIYRTESD